MKNAFGGQTSHHHRSHCKCNAAPAGTCALPVPQRLLAGLPVWRLLQHPILNLAGGGKTGRLTLKPWSIVTEVSTIRIASARAACACWMPSGSGPPTIRPKVIFVCASTLNSTWLLMRSATDIWPDGLGSSSGELGRNLMDHHFRCGAEGTSRASTISIITAVAPMAFTFRATATYSATSASICGVRLPGFREPRRMARRSGVGAGRAVQGRVGDTRTLEVRGHRLRRDAAQSCEPRWTRSLEEGQMGGLPVLEIDCATGENNA